MENKILLIDKFIVKSQIYEDNDEFTNEEFTERLYKIKKWQKELQLLKIKPLIKQRSDEWYRLRKGRLTASDLHDACDMRKHLIKNKALNTTFDLSHIQAIQWGVIFESVALKIYSSTRNRVKINEFGLIPDPYIECFGASPDGITDLGIMVEIKCPFSRKIEKGVVPPKYMSQMQGQLAVCKLEECDYAEFEFKEITQEEYFEIDHSTNPYNGIVVLYDKKTIYSKFNMLPFNAFKKYFDVDAKRVIYWKLDCMYVQKVYFNKEEWDKKYVPKIYEFWEAVTNYIPPPEIIYQFIEDD